VRARARQAIGIPSASAVILEWMSELDGLAVHGKHSWTVHSMPTPSCLIDFIEIPLPESIPFTVYTSSKLITVFHNGAWRDHGISLWSLRWAKCTIISLFLFVVPDVLGSLGFHYDFLYGKLRWDKLSMGSNMMLRSSDRSQVAMRLTFFFPAHVVHMAVKYPELVYDYALKRPFNYDALDF